MGVLTITRERIPAAALDVLRYDAEMFGQCLSGFHNRNYVIQLSHAMAGTLGLAPGTPVKVRVPLDGAMKVVERVWTDEGDVLTRLDRAIGIENTPQFFAGRPGYSVHEYVPGQALSEICPPGKPLDPHHLDALVDQLVGFTQVSADDLPPMPRGWAEPGDSRGFLRDRAAFAERAVRAPNWAEFAGLFAALEVPANALRVLRDRIPALRPRPFALLHADLHRHNVIVRDDGDLTVIDWELAMWGDPLYDLAIHLVRMRYPAHQRAEAIERWRRAVSRVRPEAAEGLDRDLPVYVAYERAQSLFADTLRVAWGLAGQPGPGLVGAGVSRVRSALHMAAGPLRLGRVPTRTEVERALLNWRRRRTARDAEAG
ncbi:aminoglycoside phosphotransferase family protein [Streptomyces sp. NPDC051976]|uniref:aminoglycoside phosphotransferase family protein n=1 Tax=Streptomyces sp. NPDC051976 TaxID=3154947 RepID=UPI00342FA249